MRKYILPILFAFGILFFSIQIYFSQKEDIKNEIHLFSASELIEIEAQPIKLEVAAKPYFVFYFSPSCDACRVGILDINQNISKLSDYNLVFISAGDKNESLTFLSNFKRPYSLFLDSNFYYSSKHKILYTPYYQIFDKNGKLLFSDKNLNSLINNKILK
ncbi:MAG: redoxin domain-containing protein [Chitinophagales bacterium]|jgi:hypothetical protein|nr:redoxin domain-containing protein [Chitinophagales bacterium]